MPKPKNRPAPVHLSMLEGAGPACLRGRGEMTDDPDKVTCSTCRKSGTMQRLLMRRARGERC